MNIYSPRVFSQSARLDPRVLRVSHTSRHVKGEAANRHGTQNRENYTCSEPLLEEEKVKKDSKKGEKKMEKTLIGKG